MICSYAGPGYHLTWGRSAGAKRKIRMDLDPMEPDQAFPHSWLLRGAPTDSPTGRWYPPIDAYPHTGAGGGEEEGHPTTHPPIMEG